ncbi:Ig-like domain-containing protein [Streptomyces sp. DG2A-72]|uniref:Ig-like domain-containing protein n=1 Tax=Streptomyces sp. DG2A-72 TaxID=3051386 RepID=UPI00265C6AC5|nr:Ig-like domain-containing protein [Streptomyces sp. DG2A-72]MDO0935888.1 Ig-like domain-containing protein [Streptomyces sp. DG2A-72]
MTVLHPFRRAAAIVAACAVLALGVVALVASQSQPARAASVGEFTMTPNTGKVTDSQPFAGSIQLPAACPVFEDGGETIPFNYDLVLGVVGPDGQEVRALDNIRDGSPYSEPTSTVSLAPEDNPGMTVLDLSNVLNSDGTYELRVRCRDDFGGFAPGEPYWSQKISVSGDTWMVGEGVQATSVVLGADDLDAEIGQEVTLTATVTPTDAAGTVAFLEGETSLGEATVANGKAEFKTKTLSEGSHDIVARFTPTDATKFGSSESASARVQVRLARYEMQDGSGKRLAENPALERGQKVKLIVRRCQPDTTFALAMERNDAEFPSAKSDAGGTVTWQELAIPDDAVEGDSAWTLSPGCTGEVVTDGTLAAVPFTVPAPSSESPGDDPSDEPSDDPSDDPSGEPSDDPSGDTSGTTSGTTSGAADGGSTTGGDSTSGGTSPQGGLASTGSQIALFSGIGAIVLTAAGIAFVRYGRRNGLLNFGDPNA